MILIGMFDSPFVRRVAVSAKRLGLEFEHRPWSVGADFARIRQYNPLGRVPTLVLDDGEVLIDSGAILDWLDGQAGPGRALTPATGVPRRHCLQRMALAIGAAEKGILQIYEDAFRPTEKRHEPWLDRCRTQMNAALDQLERVVGELPANAWLGGSAPNQADITVACVYTFLCAAVGIDGAARPALAALVARAEALAEFQSTRITFQRPRG